MESENFKGVEDNFQRYKENVADLTQEFELGLFLYLLNKITVSYTHLTLPTSQYV